MSTPTITSLAFLTPRNFADDDPYPGLEETLRLFEFGEPLYYRAEAHRLLGDTTASRAGMQSVASGHTRLARAAGEFPTART